MLELVARKDAEPTVGPRPIGAVLDDVCRAIDEFIPELPDSCEWRWVLLTLRRAIAVPR